MTGKTVSSGTRDVKMMVPLKYLSNFCKTLEMPLIYCKINLILTWTDKLVLSNDYND